MITLIKHKNLLNKHHSHKIQLINNLELKNIKIDYCINIILLKKKNISRFYIFYHKLQIKLIRYIILCSLRYNFTIIYSNYVAFLLIRILNNIFFFILKITFFGLASDYLFIIILF